MPIFQVETHGAMWRTTNIGPPSEQRSQWRFAHIKYDYYLHITETFEQDQGPWHIYLKKSVPVTSAT